ncbi:hypothetical protein NIES4106_58260 (plasmid) [Fischerella sp. NIES-4106]|nr:hypothetical protein NIES4106_58260 [Fischerella sp. NIES-4106]
MSNGVDKQLDEEQKVSASREWTEAAFANLLNVEDNGVIGMDTYDEDEVKQEQTQPTEHQTSYINPNVVAISELFDDPHSGKTQPTLASNPFAKFGTVGLGFGVVFVIAASVASKIMTAPRVAPPMAKTTPQAKPEVVVADKQEVETGKYKAELALDEQAKTIFTLRSSKNPKTSVTKPNFQTLNQSNKQTTKHATSPSSPVQNSHTKEPITTREATVLRPQPTVNAVPTLARTKQSTDPMQQWLVAANVGNLNLGNNNSDTATSVTSVQQKTVSQSINNQTNTLTQDGKQVLVGSRASGVIETPIAWSSNSNNTEQRYLIRLTQPLKTSDGSVIVPVDSYIVAQITNANQREFVQLSAVSTVINENGRGLEKPIPKNTILILGKEGKALTGKAKKGSTLTGDLTASILSGISNAAEVYNRSDSEINISGNTTVVNSSERRNIGAGFAEGSFKEIVRRMQVSNQQTLPEMKSQPKVYLIEQGTSVQVFVNQTIFL